ncbi:MAG: 1-acyl-sn-glycerol-3-phosphate acyltransferase [Ilumatobacteraceae bacterium]|nr:1-acyl-sn-glycerol-3-phosphate acyltransferase [Ilumatobacteraceae bacterium]
MNKNLRRAQKATGIVESAVTRVATPLRNFGFPYRAPTVPRGVSVPAEVSGLGAHYDTNWARRPLASTVRGAITEGPMRLAARLLTDPEIVGTDRLADLMALEDPPPVIFAPTHHSHLDTGLVIRSVPATWRHNLVVAAAADYFFDKKWKAALSALSLNAIPIDREVTGRKSSDAISDLVKDGYSLIIYPEGGRSPDGWGQDFKGGAAYMSNKTGAPVIPVFIDGTGAIFGKGMKRPKPGRTTVAFGAPMRADDGESTRKFNARIEAAVTILGDESITDFWSARQRAAAGDSPSLNGPEFNGWRRDWALAERRKLGHAGLRRRQQRRWPNLD